MTEFANRDQIQVIQTGDYVWSRTLHCAARVETVCIDVYGFAYAVLLDAAQYGHVHALIRDLSPAYSNTLH